jgi:mono/diheme cytochrome c family protein
MLAFVLLLAVGGCGDDEAKKEAAARARAKAALHARLMAVGRKLFVKNCQLCHTIAGRVAHPTFIESPIPNLDEVRPRAEYVVERLRDGGIDMGTFSGFRGAQLRALVTYITTVAGSRVVDTSAREGPLVIAAGEQVFRDNCESCHGIDGRKASGTPLYPGTDFNRVKPSQAMVQERALEGAEEIMPSFRGKLSEDELHALAVYVTATAGR